MLALSTSCSKDEYVLPEGFEVVWNKANIYFVYLHENLLGEKSDQRRGAGTLCDRDAHKDCEVYMWSDRKNIPDGLPIRNKGSFIHSSYKRDISGEIKYKCVECD